MINKKGFTLVEILVVVAIIGILAATTLTAIGPARAKAKDARVISALTQVRAIAETLYDGNTGTYPTPPFPSNGSVLPGTSDLGKTAQEIVNQASQLFLDRDAGNAKYAMYARLPSSPTAPASSQVFWCVDSSGSSKQFTGASGAPAGTGQCP